MARKTQTKGRCLYCGREMTRGGLTRHLPDCPVRVHADAEADAGAGKIQTLYHLQVQDAYDGMFWLQLEMNGDATLTRLDRYLRAIWLECCGHLSEFYIGRRYGIKAAMSRKADQVFAPGVELTHIYDFGTSSETLIKVVGARQGKPTTKHPIALMARNAMPESKCMECGKQAAYLCIECMDEHDQSGELCEEHAAAHPHHNYGEPMPFVNSPRVGMCGYEAPADPPY